MLTDCADRVHRLALARVVLPHGHQPIEPGVDDGVGEAVLGLGARQRLRLRPGAVAAERLLVDALVPADPRVDPVLGLIGLQCQSQLSCWSKLSLVSSVTEMLRSTCQRCMPELAAFNAGCFTVLPTA